VWDARPTLTIWVYDSSGGVAAGEMRLQALVHRHALTLLDAVTVTWVAGTHRPRIGPVRGNSLRDPSRARLLGTFVKLLTLPGSGGGPAQLAQRLVDTGTDEPFLSDAARALAPNTSALLVLSTHVDLDTVRPVIERGRARGDVVLLHAYWRRTESS